MLNLYERLEEQSAWSPSKKEPVFDSTTEILATRWRKAHLVYYYLMTNYNGPLLNRISHTTRSFQSKPVFLEPKAQHLLYREEEKSQLTNHEIALEILLKIGWSPTLTFEANLLSPEPLPGINWAKIKWNYDGESTRKQTDLPSSKFLLQSIITKRNHTRRVPRCYLKIQR